MFAIYPQWNFLKTIVFIALFLPVLGWAQVPTNGLVAYYPFNGNANDESGNGNNPTTNTATLTSDRFGNVNKAYSFTSTNTFLSVNPRVTMPMNTFDAFHFSTWIKPIELGAGSRIAVFVDASNNSHEIVFDHNTRKILFFSWRGSYQMQLFSTTTISLNEWTQLSINVDYNTSTTNLYINGALNATSNLHSAPL